MTADFERRMFEARLKSTYIHDNVQVYDILHSVLGHQADDIEGRAELRAVIYALAHITGGVVLGMSIGKDLETIKESLPILIQAFAEFDEREAQKPIDRAQLRTLILSAFDSEPKWYPGELTEKIHHRGADVRAMLDELVSEGLLRLKSREYQKVKRQRKVKP